MAGNREYFVGERECLGLDARSEQHHELVASNPKDAIVLRQKRHDLSRESVQEFVSFDMTHVPVEELQVVYVKQE